MRRYFNFVHLFRAALCGLLLSFAAGHSFAQTKEKTTTEAGLFLDLQRINLGTISSLEEKKNYLMTIQLEKQRIQNHMLRGIYENAYDLYRQGDYERSQELTAKILSIDPTFQDAQMLLQASGQLKGASRGIGEQVMLEDRFDEGMNLYKEGKVVEAIRKWEEVLKLSPGNMRASYWLKKAKKEISDEYSRRGDDAAARNRLKEALDNWYNALIYDKSNQELLAKVAEKEDEMREQVASQNLNYGLELYEAGKLVEAYSALKKVLEVQPGDTKAQKLVKEVRGEIAKGYVAQGRKSYGDRRYPDAIESWNKARSWGYAPDFIDQLIARAKEMIKRESEEKKARADQAKKDADAAAEAAKRKREEEQAEKMKAAMDGATGEKSGTALPAGGKSGPSEENRRAAQKRYETGLGYLMTGDYERARTEFNAAKHLDPSNPDVDAGLRKIDTMLGQQ